MNEIKIVLKLIVLSIGIITVGILLNYTNTYTTDNNNDDYDNYDERIFNTNSYYTDATIMVENIHWEYTVNTFISYISNEKIDKAFDMLTDECKEKNFDNNIDSFTNDFVEKIKSENIMNYELSLVSENYNEGVGVITYILKINELEIDLVLYDKGPFNQKISINSYID